MNSADVSIATIVKRKIKHTPNEQDNHLDDPKRNG
jgi:hypothetical protein